MNLSLFFVIPRNEESPQETNTKLIKHVEQLVEIARSSENSIKNLLLKLSALALMEAASPDLEKQGFLAVVFVYWEYSGQQETAPENYP